MYTKFNNLRRKLTAASREVKEENLSSTSTEQNFIGEKETAKFQFHNCHDVNDANPLVFSVFYESTIAFEHELVDSPDTLSPPLHREMLDLVRVN